MKHHEEEKLGKAHHKFELNAEKIQSEQEGPAVKELDDLEYFESNKKEVTFKIISAQGSLQISLIESIKLSHIFK